MEINLLIIITQLYTRQLKQKTGHREFMRH